MNSEQILTLDLVRLSKVTHWVSHRRDTSIVLPGTILTLLEEKVSLTLMIKCLTAVFLREQRRYIVQVPPLLAVIEPKVSNNGPNTVF